MNKIMAQLIGLEVKATLGAPALLSELWKNLPGISKANFDQDILDLAKSGKYILIRHSHPERLTMEEKELMIQDSEGGFYESIFPQSELKPTTFRRKEKPATPAHLKRVTLNDACKVPQWMNEWLQKEGNVCNLIEEALIEKFKLVPPEM